MDTQICQNCGMPMGARDLFCLNCGHMAGQPVGNMDPIRSGTTVIARKSDLVQNRIKPVPDDSPSPGAPNDSPSPMAPKESNELLPATREGYCTNCGFKYRVGWIYCMQCGEVLVAARREAARAAQAVPQTPVAPQTQVVPQAPVEPSPIPPQQVQEPRSNSFAYQQNIDAPTPVTRNPEVPTTTTRVADLSALGAEQRQGSDSGFSFTNVNSVADMSYGVMDDADDSPTALYNDEYDMDSPTMLYEPEAPVKVYTLTRTATGQSQTLTLPEVLGKGSKATLRVSGSRVVSREHAKLYEEGGVPYLEDLGSMNKTYVNGRQVLPHVPTALNSGDVIMLADVEFVFAIDEQ